MRIPVFVSCPTQLGPQQDKARRYIDNLLKNLQLEPRALGRGDFPDDYPLKEVATIARHCSGGIILGFTQFETDSGIWKKETSEEAPQTELIGFPTPWNQLEAGILFGLRLPLMIFREPAVSGGVFDPGVTDVFVHPMPIPPLNPASKDALWQVFLKWSSKVRENYYSET